LPSTIDILKKLKLPMFTIMLNHFVEVKSEQFSGFGRIDQLWYDSTKQPPQLLSVLYVYSCPSDEPDISGYFEIKPSFYYRLISPWSICRFVNIVPFDLDPFVALGKRPTFKDWESDHFKDSLCIISI